MGREGTFAPRSVARDMTGWWFVDTITICTGASGVFVRAVGEPELGLKC